MRTSFGSYIGTPRNEGHVEMSATSSLEKMMQGDVKAPDKCKKHPKEEKRAHSKGERRGGNLVRPARNVDRESLALLYRR